MRVSDADILILPAPAMRALTIGSRAGWRNFDGAIRGAGRLERSSRDAWVAQIVEAVRATERPCVLVPHGLAVIAAAHAAPALGPRVKGAFLVAPSATLGQEHFREVGTGSREENAIRPKAASSFSAKWAPVRVKKMRKDKVLEHVRAKWAPVRVKRMR